MSKTLPNCNGTLVPQFSFVIFLAIFFIVTAFYVTMIFRQPSRDLSLNTATRAQFSLRLTEIRRVTISSFIAVELRTYQSVRPNTSYNGIAVKVGTINPSLVEPVSRLVFLSFTDLSHTGADAATLTNKHDFIQKEKSLLGNTIQYNTFY